MYRINGNALTYNGNEIQLHGVNWIGNEQQAQPIFHGLWSSTYASYLDKIKSMGHNFIRIPIGPNCIRSVDILPTMDAETWLNKDLANKNSLEILDIVIGAMEFRGIRYAFDWHYLDAKGNIPDLWYTDAEPEEQWLEDLSFLADRYSGKNGFVGIDIKNEPGKACTYGDGNPKTDWKMAIEKGAEAIFAVNDDILCIYEWLSVEGGLSQIFDNRPNIAADRGLPSNHVYGPAVWDFEPKFNASDFPANMPDYWKKMFGSALGKTPIYLGEFGGLYTGKDKQYFDAFVPWLIANGVTNTSWWGLTPSSGPTTLGIFTGDSADNVNQDKVNLLKKLKTDKATFTTDKAPIPTPVVTGLFKELDKVNFITLNGPLMVVQGYASAGIVKVVYYNDKTGEFAASLMPENMLLKKAATVKSKAPAVKSKTSAKKPRRKS